MGTFGEEFRRIRNKVFMTQGAIGEILGISTVQVSRIEQGETVLGEVTVAKLMDELGQSQETPVLLAALAKHKGSVSIPVGKQSDEVLIRMVEFARSCARMNRGQWDTVCAIAKE